LGTHLLMSSSSFGVIVPAGPIEKGQTAISPPDVAGAGLWVQLQGCEMVDEVFVDGRLDFLALLALFGCDFSSHVGFGFRYDG
jgi:hypothetical protein